MHLEYYMPLFARVYFFWHSLTRVHRGLQKSWFMISFYTGLALSADNVAYWSGCIKTTLAQNSSSHVLRAFHPVYAVSGRMTIIPWCRVGSGLYRVLTVENTKYLEWFFDSQPTVWPPGSQSRLLGDGAPVSYRRRGLSTLHAPPEQSRLNEEPDFRVSARYDTNTWAFQ